MLTPVHCWKMQRWARKHQTWTTERGKKVAWSDDASLTWRTGGTRTHYDASGKARLGNLTSCIRLHVTHTWPPNSPDLDPTKQQVRFMEASTLQPNILVPDPTAHLQRSDWSGLFLAAKGDQTGGHNIMANWSQLSNSIFIFVFLFCFFYSVAQNGAISLSCT